MSTITVAHYGTATGTFADAGDSTGTSLCGTRTYSIEETGGGAISWQSIVSATRTITASPGASQSQ